MGRGLGALLGAAVIVVSPPAEADAIDDLEPGTWYEIPNTPMRDACPPDTADYDWSFYCQGAVSAWSGGALDTSRGRLVVWGGGHGDYRGNEVYVFDLQSLSWERVWGPSADDQIPSGGTHEEYDDGNPGSRHTYSGLTYLPPPHDALISMGGSLWQSGFYGSGVWSFSFGDNAWARLTDGPGEMGYGDPCVFDPDTGHVFRRGNSRMFEYDPDSDTFIDRASSDGGFWAANVAAALDPDARLMIIVGEGRLDTYELDTDLYTQGVAIAGSTVEDLFGMSSPGVAFDTEQERFVLYGGGLDVYTYDPDAASFAVHENGGDDPGDVSASGGAFGRFRYAPSRNAFVWVDHVDDNVFVLRMTEGTGTPPIPPGGSSSGDAGTGAGETGAGGTGAGSTGVGPGTTGGEVSSGGGGTSEGDDAKAGEGAGCGCRSGSPPWLAFVLVFGLWRRRGTRA